MFETLDRVFLMARGKVVYCGDPRSSDGFFEAAGLACPSHTAIAEHMLSAVSDPPMLARLQGHVAQNGPFAGMALVRASLSPAYAVHWILPAHVLEKAHLH